MTSIPGRQQLARGIVSFGPSGRRQVELAGGHGSHLLGDLARANALVILPSDRVRRRRRGRSTSGCSTSCSAEPAMTEAPFPHLTEAGDARMVDVSGKAVTARTATAAGLVRLSAECVAALRAGSRAQGRRAGGGPDRRHPGGQEDPGPDPAVPPAGHQRRWTSTVEVTDDGVEIVATVRTTDRTGVEMEALTAVSVAGLAVIDMIKAVDRAAVISDVRVLAKSGGRRGDWTRDDRR